MIDFDIDGATFAARYLEREVFLKRNAASLRPFDWRTLDELLHHIEPTPALFQMYSQGLIPQETYADDTIELGAPRRRLNKRGFYSQLQNGATLVLNKLECQSTAAKHACMEVARFVQQQTTSNAYLSFGGAGTFGKHWDTHDVFAIQFIGRKHWQVFRPTFEWPLNRHKSTHLAPPVNATPVLDCVLEAGDLLYVPRGWWHQVIPLDEPSFHVSVGAYLPTLFDYVMWACNRHLPHVSAVRKGIGGAATPAADLDIVLEALSEHLRSPEHLQTFLREVGAHERTTSQFNLDYLANEVRTPDEKMEVRPTSYRAPDLSRGELVVNGTTLRLDRVSQEILTHVWDAGVITLARLCERLPHTTREGVRGRVLELAKHDVLNVSPAYALPT